MNRVVTRLGLTTFALVAGAMPVVAQGTQTANITGTIVDSTGAAVAGAVVRLTSPAMQGPRTYTTDASGKFIARLLPPGFYTIDVSKDGMESRRITQQLGIDQTFNPKITMTKAGGAVIEVVAAAPAVDKTDVKTATNYRLDNVDQLPNARSMEGVALLTPGVTSGVGGRVQIRGAMTSGNLYLLDGQNISDNAYNNRGLSIIEDSIEEVQVVTGAMSAEYGDVDGGVINSITRSGGNEFSGSLRWELQNPSWNAYKPLQPRGTSDNILGEQKTLSLSGPILKDKLWFSASYFTTKSTGSSTIGGDLSSDPFALGAANGPGGLNTGFTTGRNEIRRQAKLTWAVTQDHTLVASFQKNEINDVNRDYSAGEVDALVPQKSTSEFMNVALRSAWASNFTTELRFGQKKQNLSAGGSANGQSPIYSDETGRFYNNGIFNNTDGGDQRDNRTFNLKASLFWNMAGSHQTDFGFDYYKGSRMARNEQSPTNLIYEAAGVNLTTRSAIPTAIWVYTSTAGSADNFSTGFYVNDKWSLDQHWNFQVGVRFDTYKAQNESGAKTAGASGVSPRLGLKYDLFGDSKHIFGLSFAKYNGKVLEGITNSVTGQGNPKEIDYYAFTYAAAGYDWAIADRISFAALQNPALYDTTDIAYYNDPTLNVKLNDKMKAPTVNEIQASYAYSFNFGAYGDGYVKVTGVSKKWDNLMDVSVGNNGTVTDPAGNVLYLKVWDNNPDAERKYQGLEIETLYNLNSWNYTASATWSKLEGNYEGEGTSTPARGETIHNYDVVGGTQLYDYNWTAANGRLSGNVPLRIRATASKVFNNSLGKSSVGLVYRFDAGSPFTHGRTISRARLNPALPGQFGASATQARGQVRGEGTFNGSTYVDLAFTHDFPLFKIAGKDVTAFAKVNIGNVFNHQQVVTFNTTYAAATGTYGNPGQGLDSPWVQGGNFGKPTASGNYGSARTITMSAGFRF